ncbi:MAG: carbohydrate kinase [Verrucomicrobiae bacterium]|nr:carbohydrate kinase [Verrucomicrobiae bacterium]MCP5521782.1 carbohydrate kinase [Verrucomicrobiales bacterium]
MNADRFAEITDRYAGLNVVVVGDFCLDRYLEIDPARAEISIETGLPVYNVVNVRSQPGAAGTILNNLVALGAGRIHPVGFCGCDGEGYELQQALGALRGVCGERLLQTSQRRTFVYCKPLIMEPGQAPRELNRLDSKNWTVTPEEVSAALAEAVRDLGRSADAIIVLDQVDQEGTGVVTREVLEAVAQVAKARPHMPVLADSRRGLRGFPALIFKMNGVELAALLGETAPGSPELQECQERAAELARRNGRPVIVTLAEQGMLGALPGGEIAHVPALPLRGEIDIVGAGDSVTANVTAALAAGANLREALELAALASSHVIHQLGTTGAAGVADLRALRTLLG